MISRPLIILLALVAAVFRAQQQAWTEAVGLAALGAGLLILRAAETRPALRQYAYLSFFITAMSVITVFYRRYL